MAIPLVCANCFARFGVPDSAAGRHAECPRCQTAMVVPDGPPGDPVFAVDEDEEPVARSMAARNVVAGLVLVAIVGAAGYVFHVRSGRDDANTGPPGGATPARPAHPNADPRIGSVQGVMNELAMAVNTTTAALDQFSDRDSAARACERLRDNAALLRELAGRLKAVGELSPDEYRHVMVPSNAAAEKLVAAMKRANAVAEVELPPDDRDRLRAELREFSRAFATMEAAMRAAFPPPGKE